MSDEAYEYERAMIRLASTHAAHTIAQSMDPAVGDVVALADQFEAAGLDCLASHGCDVRTKLDEGKP